jgi:hypothetical protein
MAGGWVYLRVDSAHDPPRGPLRTCGARVAEAGVVYFTVNTEQVVMTTTASCTSAEVSDELVVIATCHAALQLATVVLIVGRLLDYRNRWSPRLSTYPLKS